MSSTSQAQADADKQAHAERNKEILDKTSPEQKVLLDAIVKAIMAEKQKAAAAAAATGTSPTDSTKTTAAGKAKAQQQQQSTKSTTSPKSTQSQEQTTEEKEEDPTQTDQFAQLMTFLLTTLPKLDIQEYVNEKLGRRFSVVNGKLLLAHLASMDYNKLSTKLSKTEFPDIKVFADFSMPDFETAITTMVQRGYLKRVVPLAVNKKKFQTQHNVRIDFAEPDAQQYDDDGLYAFMLQPQSSSWALVKSLLVVLAIFLICCYKIWPIFLRIVLWWLLLFTTIFLVSSIIIHLLSKVIFTLLCLRGYSVMPNLLDDEVGFFQTFSPIFGTGGEHQRRWKLERQFQIKAREKLFGKASPKKLPESPTDADKPTTLATTNTEADLPTELPAENIFHSWQAGVLAFIIFFIVGAIGAYAAGLFDPELVPDFVVNNAEMRYYFPQIAATDPTDFANEEVSMA